MREPVAAEFLNALIASSEKRKRIIPHGLLLWRAQIGTDTRDKEFENVDARIVVEEPYPFSAERMKPLKQSATEGRANPKGIPCLYLATDKDTAMGEVRPWLGELLSVGQFITIKELTVIDASKYHNAKPNLDFLTRSITDGELEEVAWTHVDLAFSAPVINVALTSDYVPTQIIAEAFREKGYDGIVYKSRLGDGHTVALFNMDSAQLVACGIYHAEKIQFTFKEDGPNYFVGSVGAL